MHGQGANYPRHQGQQPQHNQQQQQQQQQYQQQLRYQQVQQQDAAQYDRVQSTGYDYNRGTSNGGSDSSWTNDGKGGRVKKKKKGWFGRGSSKTEQKPQLNVVQQPHQQTAQPYGQPPPAYSMSMGVHSYGGAPGGYAPPPQGGYAPPPQGGYPPPQGGYPPPGYPPPGGYHGGYPPHGGYGPPGGQGYSGFGGGFGGGMFGGMFGGGGGGGNNDFMTGLLFGAILADDD